MTFVVSVAPHAGGFQARTGGPLDLTADGPTADAAVAAVRDLVATRVRSGEMRVIHVADVQTIVEAATRLSKNPQLGAYTEELAENRRLHNAVPDAD